MNLLTALNTLLLLATPVNTAEVEVEPVGFQVEIYPFGGYYSYPPCPNGYEYYNGYCYPYGSGYYFYYGPGYYNRYYGRGRHYRGRRHGRRSYRGRHGGSGRRHGGGRHGGGRGRR